MAEGYLQQLKDTYPQSDYITIAENIKDGKEPAGAQTQPQKINTDNAPQQIKTISVKNDNKVKTGKYTIQAGAFISLNNARNLKKAGSPSPCRCCCSA
jgi:cell division septation protein DedD